MLFAQPQLSECCEPVEHGNLVLLLSVLRHNERLSVGTDGSVKAAVGGVVLEHVDLKVGDCTYSLTVSHHIVI